MSYPFTSTVGTEFPFNFLHAEIVKYYIEKHAEFKRKREEFVEKIQQNGGGQIIDNDKTLLSHLSMNVSLLQYFENGMIFLL